MTSKSEVDRPLAMLRLMQLDSISKAWMVVSKPALITFMAKMISFTIGTLAILPFYI